MAATKLNPFTTHKRVQWYYWCNCHFFWFTCIDLFFQLICNNSYSIQGINLDLNKVIEQLPSSTDDLMNLLFDKTCWTVYLLWFFILVAFDFILPGKSLNGVTLRDGTSLNYKINGLSMSLLLVTLLSARLIHLDNYYLPELDFIYSNQAQLIMVCFLFSFILAVICYIMSFIPLVKPNGLNTRDRILSINGNTYNPFYDWFIGRELNPRIGSWILNYFVNYVPVCCYGY